MGGANRRRFAGFAARFGVPLPFHARCEPVGPFCHQGDRAFCRALNLVQQTPVAGPGAGDCVADEVGEIDCDAVRDESVVGESKLVVSHHCKAIPFR